MAVSFGPFAGDPGTDPSANLGEDFYMDTIAPAFSNAGVMGDPLTADLQVTANSSGMQVFVAAGRAVARGVGYYSDASQTLSIAASTSQARIDRVVVRFNRSTNTVSTVVVQGTPATNPVPPSVTRNVGGTWEVQLAQVLVAANAVSIAASAISDEREFIGAPVIPCRSNTRPSSTVIRRGQMIWETDTSTAYVWNGSAWVTQTPDWIPRGFVNGATNPIAGGAIAGPNPGNVWSLSLLFSAVAGRRYMITAGGRFGFHAGSAAPINAVSLSMFIERPGNMTTFGANAGLGGAEFPLGDWYIEDPGFAYYTGQGSLTAVSNVTGAIQVALTVNVTTQRTDTSFSIPANALHVVAYDMGK